MYVIKTRAWATLCILYTDVAMNFFGAKKPARKANGGGGGGGGASASPAAAIGKIKEQIRVMEKAEAHLELRIKKLHVSAVKKSKAKNKSGALLDLKRKKVLEKQLANKSNQRFALEQNCFSLEVMHNNVQTVQTTKVANSAMASMTSAMYVVVIVVVIGVCCRLFVPFFSECPLAVVYCSIWLSTHPNRNALGAILPTPCLSSNTDTMRPQCIHARATLHDQLAVVGLTKSKNCMRTCRSTWTRPRRFRNY